MTNRFRAMFLAPSVAVALGLAGCNNTENITDAQNGVGRFHTQLNAQNYGAIWGTTSSEMHAATQEAALNNVLTVVHRKLGNVVGSTQLGWTVNYNSGVTYTILTMHTTFEHGTGEEQFIFKPFKGATQLVGYHINSADMMMH